MNLILLRMLRDFEPNNYWVKNNKSNYKTINSSQKYRIIVRYPKISAYNTIF